MVWITLKQVEDKGLLPVVQAVQFLTAFLMHLFKMQLRTLVLCLEPEAHGRCTGPLDSREQLGWEPPTVLRLLLPCPPACLSASQAGWIGMQLWRSASPNPCSSRVVQSWLSRTVSRQFFGISKDGESITSLGNLCNARSLSQQKKKFRF